MIFDPIADMLTRIRNALAVKHTTVEIPYSAMKKKIVEILEKEGYIKSFVTKNAVTGEVILDTVEKETEKEVEKEAEAVEEVKVEEEKCVKKVLVVTLKYYNGKPVIQGIRRISSPSLRVYTTVEDMPQVINGLGIAILTTTRGVMTNKEAKKQRIGGEVIAYVW